MAISLFLINGRILMLQATDVIDSFRGEYNFLSNFSSHGFTDKNGIVWATVEHFYQAYKANAGHEYEISDRIIKSTNPGEAKRLTKGIKPTYWHNISIDIMRQALKYKFDQNESIREKLLNTGDALLIERNTWGDEFWGQVNGKGKNILGKLLMEIRNGYRRTSEL